jgi:hypothetical protein
MLCLGLERPRPAIYRAASPRTRAHALQTASLLSETLTAAGQRGAAWRQGIEVELSGSSVGQRILLSILLSSFSVPPSDGDGGGGGGGAPHLARGESRRRRPANQLPVSFGRKRV